MKSFLRSVACALLVLMSSVAGAALDQADKMAPEPTVSVVWVALFLIIFVGFCVGVGVAIYRADKKVKVDSAKKA